MAFADPPAAGSGCPIGNAGERLVIQGYWNQSAVKRFGSDLFGSDTFGGAEGPTSPDWVDLTVYASNLDFTRGDIAWTVNPQSDRATFTIRDDAADIVDWLPPTSLASPTVATPFRIGFFSAAGEWYPVMYGRLESMADLHEDPLRQIRFSIAGTKADLSTSLLDPDRPAETVRERVEWVLNDIGWQWGVVWPADPADFAVSLYADPDANGRQRTGAASYAWNIITEAVNSAGYRCTVNNAGELIFQTFSDIVPPPAAAVITDCRDPYPIKWTSVIDANDGSQASGRTRDIVTGRNNNDITPNPAVTGGAEPGERWTFTVPGGETYTFEANPFGQIVWGDVRPSWANNPDSFGAVWLESLTPTATASTMEFNATARQVLNVVQLQNRININRSGSATDPTSVALYGRQSTGYGFPMVTVNSSDNEADAIAAGILERLAYRIAQCDAVTFSTATDSRWWDVLAAVELGSYVDVYRSEPKPLTFQCVITGFSMAPTPEAIECEVNLISLNETI